MRERSQRFDPRQIMHRDSFEVFHYREPSPSVEVHHHDFYEVYYLLGGEVEYWVDGRIIKMQPGDLLMINPQELHRPLLEESNRVYERIVLWINKDYLEAMQSDGIYLNSCFDRKIPGNSRLIRLSTSERTAMNIRMSELVREFYSADFGGDLCAYGLFLQFMVQLNRLASRVEKKQEDTHQLSDLVEKTLHYIGDNLSAPLTLEAMAARFYVSKYYLSHAFTKEVGVSVYRYIMMRRLMMARQLLLAGETAGQVCRSCGFSDYTSFYRAFKSEYGVSPRTFAANEA